MRSTLRRLDFSTLYVLRQRDDQPVAQGCAFRLAAKLRIITEIDSISSTNQRSTSVETDRQETHGWWWSSPKWVLSLERQHGSPVGVRCHGWCEEDFIPRATVVS